MRRFNNSKNQKWTQLLKEPWDSFYYNKEYENKEIVEKMLKDILEREHDDDDDDNDDDTGNWLMKFIIYIYIYIYLILVLNYNCLN